MDEPQDWPTKAYKNGAFLSSPDAREIRVLCEFMEPGARLRRRRIRNTVVFFGSTRALPRDVAQARLREAERGGGDGNGSRAIADARRDEEMSRYYEDARRVAYELTQWGKTLPSKRRFAVCSGGGSGIMEAANRGAMEAGGPSIGMNISLPEQQRPNPYITRSLSFEFHYFFIRKFWFAYLAKALVVFPGGFGTMDELFEVLTLAQTHKTRKYMPILIYGPEYWRRLINFEMLVERGTIDPEDMDLLHFVESVPETVSFLQETLAKANSRGA